MIELVNIFKVYGQKGIDSVRFEFIHRIDPYVSKDILVVWSSIYQEAKCPLCSGFNIGRTNFIGGSVALPPGLFCCHCSDTFIFLFVLKFNWIK